MNGDSPGGGGILPGHLYRYRGAEDIWGISLYLVLFVPKGEHRGSFAYGVDDTYITCLATERDYDAPMITRVCSVWIGFLTTTAERVDR